MLKAASEMMIRPETPYKEGTFLFWVLDYRRLPILGVPES